MKRVAIIAAALLALGACTQSSNNEADSVVIDTTTMECREGICTSAGFICVGGKRASVGVLARNVKASNQTIRMVVESSHPGTPDEEKEGTFQPDGVLKLGIAAADGVTSTIRVFNGDDKEVATVTLNPADACRPGDAVEVT